MTGTPETQKELIRNFETGAIRNIDTGKFDYEAFYTPRVMKAFATYMHFNRHLPDGTMRNGDNWQKGIPKDSYMKSGWRHFFDWWNDHRNPTEDHGTDNEGLVWALCGLIFNAQGYLDTILKENPNLLPEALEHNKLLREKRWAELKKKETT